MNKIVNINPLPENSEKTDIIDFLVKKKFDIEQTKKIKSIIKWTWISSKIVSLNWRFKEILNSKKPIKEYVFKGEENKLDIDVWEKYQVESLLWEITNDLIELFKKNTDEELHDFIIIFKDYYLDLLKKISKKFNIQKDKERENIHPLVIWLYNKINDSISWIKGIIKLNETIENTQSGAENILKKEQT